MKRVKIFLLLFTMCCTLTACGTKPVEDVTQPDDETPAVDVDWFNTEFFNMGSGVCMTNMMLSSYYDTAADIDLYSSSTMAQREYRKRSLRRNRQRSAR